MSGGCSVREQTVSRSARVNPTSQSYKPAALLQSRVHLCVYIYARVWLVLYRGLSYSMPLSRCVLIDSATRGRSSGERFLRRERRNVRARGRVFVSEGRRQAVVVGIRTARDLLRPGVRCDVTCV